MAETPVFQVKKNLGSAYDYDYVVGKAAADAAAAQGYEIECVAFCAEDAPGTDLAEFRRYTYPPGYHFYTTNPTGESLNGWTYALANTTAYLATSGIVLGSVLLERYVDESFQLSHFFSADVGTNPPPSGYVAGLSGHTGFVRPVTRVEFQVSYNGNGRSSGITVTGGNATGQEITVDGQPYVMKPDDALVGYGIGNWIGYNKDGGTDWHFSDISVTPGGGDTFVKVRYADDSKIALIDNDLDNTNSDVSYEYTLKIHDEKLDRTITFDPKIINRSQDGGPPN